MQVYVTLEGDGKEAITRYRLLQTNNSYSLLELELETGRKNQIRIFLRPAFYYRYIGTLGNHFAPVGLKLFLYALIFSEHHDTRRIPIQTVQNEYLITRIGLFHIIA